MLSPTRFRKYLALPPADRRLVVRAALWLIVVRAALWAVPLRTLLHRIERMNGRQPRGEDAGEAERIGWAVQAAGRYVPGARGCLPRALAGTILLRRSGRSARLRLGLARNEGGRAEAHAWVECDGRVVIGKDELERYVPIPVMKGAAE